VLLGARGTPLEVGSHARNRRLRADAGELELDVAIELLEAEVTPDVGEAVAAARDDLPGQIARTGDVVRHVWLVSCPAALLRGPVTGRLP
jgi:hypothetical protein